MQDQPDYLDADVAYLVGMIVGRGCFQQEGDIRRLTIRFPYRLPAMTTLPGSELDIDRETELRLALDDVRRRVNELLEVDIDVERLSHEVIVKAVFTKNTMSWRNLRLLCGQAASHREMRVPSQIREAPDDLVREFLRGVADTCAVPSAADYFMQREGRQRVVLQFPQENWLLPLDVCYLLQVRLGIPVQGILWGHPNIRAPAGGSWAKEHRLRVFADQFRPVGFNFAYKQRAFEELASWNETRAPGPARLCNPRARRVRRRKPRHPDEGDPRLPEALRRHFNAAFKVCLALGCRQGRRVRTTTPDEEAEELEQ